MKTTFAIIGSLVAVIALVWLFQGNDFFLYKVFAPRYESVRRNVFEQTKSYNQGMIQELQNMQFEYVKADTNRQDALASIILHRCADYDMTILQARNPELYQFVQNLKHQQIEKP